MPVIIKSFQPSAKSRDQLHPDMAAEGMPEHNDRAHFEAVEDCECGVRVRWHRIMTAVRREGTRWSIGGSAMAREIEGDDSMGCC